MKKNKTKHFLITLILFALALNAFSQVFTYPVITRISEGHQFVEGPVWYAEDTLLFSDIPANTIYGWTEAGGTFPFINPSGNSNGLGMSNEGELIICQHGERQVSKMNADKSLTPIAAQYNGMQLNSPNDLCFHSDGSIFFTDPPYGLSNPGDSETGFNGIYRLSPEGDVQLLDSTLNRPNGIAFSPDESKLYVTDSEARKIFIWDVTDDTTIVNKQEFAYQAPQGYTDGMKVDAEGYVYSTGPIGVWVYHPDGTVLDTIEVPGQTTNCAWGGANGDILFVTSGNSVYKIEDGEPPSALLNDKSEIHSISPYPNPFNDSAEIPFYLNSTQQVTLRIFNAEGKQIEVLLDENRKSGYHSVIWNSKINESGIYYAKLEMLKDGIEKSFQLIKL